MTTVVAVVVTYNPGVLFETRLLSYLNQVRAVIVVDNSTSNECRERIATVCARYSPCKLVSSQGNQGLAKAQNLGISLAIEHFDPEWILLMDDDSIADGAMIKTMLEGYQQYKYQDRVAILAPLVVNSHDNSVNSVIASGGVFGVRRIKGNSIRFTCDNVLTVIASGSMVKVSVLRECGYLRSDYFIDSIDTEYSLRVRSAKKTILVIGLSRIFHNLGAKTNHDFFGVTFATTNHASWRRYMMYRNRFDVWRTYLFVFPSYVAYDFMVSIFEIIKIIAFEKDKYKKIAAAARGVMDGWRRNFSWTPSAS